MATKIKKQEPEIDIEEAEQDNGAAVAKAKDIAMNLFGRDVPPMQVFELHRQRVLFVDEEEDIRLFEEELRLARAVCVELFGEEQTSAEVVLKYFDDVVLEARGVYDEE